MSFYLEDDMIFVIELDHSGVVLENADAPIFGPKHFTNFHGGCKDGFLEHALKLASTIFIVVLDFSTERFVAAMFAPGLRDRWAHDLARENDLGWFAFQRWKDKAVRFY